MVFKSNQKHNLLTKTFIAIVIILMIVSIMLISGFTPLRFDFAGGTHRILPTAVDSDIWGNYKVYYKTSDFTHSRTEEFYYIDKDRHDLVEQVNRSINNTQEMVIYYDKYVGWQGFTAPKSAPIVRIEIVRSGIKQINYNPIQI